MKVFLLSLFPEIEYIGIRLLSACLKQEEHDVKILFLQKPSTEEYSKTDLNEICELVAESDLIGISLTTNHFKNATMLTKEIQKKVNVPIIWGGIHPTIRPVECLDFADLVCIGEGEGPLIDLARKMEIGENYTEINGLWVKKNGEIIKNNCRPIIQDLDSIPFPDYDYSDHYVFAKHLRQMSYEILKESLDGKYSTMATRGCPFSCTFCVNNTLNKTSDSPFKIRKRSNQNIIKELLEVRAKLPFIERILLEDDGFFIKASDDIKDFSEKYRDSIKLPLWVGGAYPTTINREKIKVLVDAGMESIRMGIQSGSNQVRKLYGRLYSNDKIEESHKIINEYKDVLLPNYDIILDNPWEKQDDLVEGLELLSRLPAPFRLNLFSLTFFPETPLYYKAVAERIILDNDENVYAKIYDANSISRTYHNKLFILLAKYVQRDSNIRPKIINVLTNSTIIRLHVNWIIYVLVNVYGGIIRVRYYIRKAIKCLIDRDLGMLFSYVKKYFKNKSNES